MNRRDFFKLLGSSAAGAAVLATLPAELAENPEEKLQPPPEKTRYIQLLDSSVSTDWAGPWIDNGWHLTK